MSTFQLSQPRAQVPVSKVLTVFIVFAILTFFFSLNADAGTTGTEFLALYTQIQGWATGYLGRIFAVSAFLVGCGFSAARQNPMPAIFGLVLAMIIGFGPTLISSILSATV